MITTSAVKYNGKIYTGRRHGDCYREVRKEYPDAEFVNPDDEGFLDDKGNFLRRRPALYHAMKCGQIDKPKFQPHELFSEDLW
jgi:hypothetical protein